jgi:hypothetical protein
MKIIEAMKALKDNDAKVADLQAKISQHCARLSFETSPYSDPRAQVREWVQSCNDLSQYSATLLVRLAKTNLLTSVTIELGGKQVTKSIAEWVWRRRKFAKLDMETWLRLNDRGLKEGTLPSTQGIAEKVFVLRSYDAEERDKMVAIFSSEPSKIDATLEIVNATTDLVE